MKKGKVLGNIVKVGIIAGAIGGISYARHKAAGREWEEKEKYKMYYQLAKRWLDNKNEGKDIGQFFKDNGIKTIAIYGLGTLGELFYEDIKKTDIKVLYFIDKNAEGLYRKEDEPEVVAISDVCRKEMPDAIVITPVYDYNDIDNELEEAGCNIMRISLEDVIYGE